MSFKVQFTCKEKIENDKPLKAANGEEVSVGIVKWVVDIVDCSDNSILEKFDAIDQAGQTVGIATILTMVKKKH
jgi:hypothetical protein